jgi:hypothetical protein
MNNSCSNCLGYYDTHAKDKEIFYCKIKKTQMRCNKDISVCNKWRPIALKEEREDSEGEAMIQRELDNY